MNNICKYEYSDGSPCGREVGIAGNLFCSQHRPSDGERIKQLEAELADARELGPCKLHPKQFFVSADPHDPGHCTLCDREKAAIAATTDKAVGEALADAAMELSNTGKLTIDGCVGDFLTYSPWLKQHTGAAIAAALEQAAASFEHLYSGNWIARSIRSFITPDQSAAPAAPARKSE